MKLHQREQLEAEKARMVSPQEGVKFQEVKERQAPEEKEETQAPEQVEEKGVPGRR